MYKSKDSSLKTELPTGLRYLAWGLNSTITNDMLGELPLCIGMPVMITENVSIACRIVNGSQGKVESITYSVDVEGNLYAQCVFVKVTSSHADIVSARPDVIPILPSTARFRFTDSTSNSFIIK